MKNKKKKKELNSKKDLLGGLIIIVLLLLILVTYIMCYEYKKNEKKLDIKDNSLSVINIYDDYTVSKAIEKESIDNSKKILATYNCKYDDCDIYTNNSFDNLYDERYLIIKENNKVFIYDFSNNKVVSNFYDEIITKLENNNYIIKNDNKSGMINNEGTEIVIPNYDEIEYQNIYDNKVKLKKDNKYGMLNIENGTVLIEPHYENINIDSTHNYSILQNNLWYVIDSNENILTNGYNYTFAFNKGYIALVDSSLQILNYNKEEMVLLNETVIPIYNIENGFKIERKSNVIYIEVYNNEETIKYEYNINRNNLKNK